LFEGLRPDWVVVLGDRVEAFAGAAAASIGGAAVAHIHAGDRAEGIADEAMRHACSKMSHLLLAATESSAARLIRMGERAEDVRVVGSPAVDGLEEAAAMSDARARELGDPCAAVLLHPSGQSEEEERALARAVVAAAEAACAPGGALLLAPNHDAGRSAIMEELGAASARLGWALVHHLPRGEFIGLLKRLAAGARGFLIGNSSAGLIEAAALRLPAVNVGARQAGRERPDNVIDAVSAGEIAGAVARALALDRARITHPYGDGRAGERIAGLLAAVDPHDRVRLRKRCSY
jgi:UDP-hydrolysing UDP-N-acetyl-D-glucosamine 2-epimerase